MEPRTVQLPSFSLRAAVAPDTIDEANRTVEVVWSTGAAVKRYDWRRGEYYLEKLSLDPKAVDLSRLNSGAPLLNAHSAWDISDVIGVVVDGSAIVDGKEGRARIRFSRAPEDNSAWEKVRDRVVRNVSVGYDPTRYEEEGEEGGLPIRTAVKWTPYEISMVPMGADPGAQTRGQGRLDLGETHPCLIVRKEPAMPENKTTAPEAAPVETRAVPPPAAAPVATAIDAQAVAKAERERQAEIRKLVRASGLEGQDALVDAYGAGTQTLDQIRADIMEKRAALSLEHEPSPSRVRVGDDASDKRRTGMEAAILVRSGAIHILQRAAKAQPENPLFQKLPTDAGEFRGMRMLRMFEQDQESRGVKVRGIDEMELAGRAMTEIARAWERGLGDLVKRGIDGGQVGADFPVALVNAMHKTALGKYALAPATWRRFCGVGTVNDFRAHPQFRASGIAALSRIQANGEFTNRDIADAYRENLTAQTYGNIVALTRQVLIDDDMGFFSDIVGDLGNAAGETIEALVYALLNTAGGLGPLLLDGVALFDAAHANLGAAGAIGVAKFDADRVIMGAQTDLTGRILDLMPSVLVVPNGSKGQATVINESEFDIDAVGAGTPPANRPNRVRGLFTDIVGTARLAGTRYYIFADPQLYPTIKVGFLNGQQEPFLEMQPGWRVDGTEWKVRLDVAVGAVDFRTALTAAGA